MPQTFKICDDRLVLADATLWLVDYDHDTGLVLSITENENNAATFPTEDKASEVCYLINNNQNNSFIGQVPPPRT